MKKKERRMKKNFWFVLLCLSTATLFSQDLGRALVKAMSEGDLISAKNFMLQVQM